MRRAALHAALALAALAAPGTAVAGYGEGAQIVSADFERLEQGDDATVFAAISANGRYVAIQTRARNFFDDDDPDPPGQYRAGGVFRFDLNDKSLEKVADGDLFDEASNEFLRRGAANPSISASGRYVAFATAEQLIPVDENDNADVYVRDMDIPLGSPGAFDLVSARDGGDVPASYGEPEFPFPGSEPGTDISRGVAISADGRKVAFRTVAPSDLPASAAVDVPAGQVFLRDRQANTTTLVTEVRDPESGAMTGQPAGGAVGAALSADGTTVAWTGGNAPSQTRFLGGEVTDPGNLYYLWRRLGDGSAAPTRRITGLSDPDDPGCPFGSTTFFDQTSTGPCFGPLTHEEGNRAAIDSQLPALSGDGYTVAFLTGAGPRPIAFTNPGFDLFVTSMRPGRKRKAATEELTRDTVGGDTATSPALSSVAISRDGRYIAATSVRTRFVLPALDQLGDPRPVPGPRELYLVDLDDRTIERVARSHRGGDIDASVQNGITLSEDAERVAFTSFAGNLFFGDANRSPDAFVAEREPERGTEPPPPVLGALLPPATIETGGGPPIRARARSRRNGVVVIVVSVPAAGGVRAVAKARVGRPRRLRNIGAAKARARGHVRTRVRLRLRPVRRYRRELRKRGRIRGRAVIAYVASQGGRRARAVTRVVFRVGKRKVRKRRAKRGGGRANRGKRERPGRAGKSTNGHALDTN